MRGLFSTQLEVSSFSLLYSHFFPWFGRNYLEIAPPSDWGYFPDLPPDTKKTRQRIHGIVLTSVSGSKWKVRWDDGQIEDIPKVCLKFESPPDSDSELVVNMAMGGNR